MLELPAQIEVLEPFKVNAGGAVTVAVTIVLADEQDNVEIFQL